MSHLALSLLLIIISFTASSCLYQDNKVSPTTSQSAVEDNVNTWKPFSSPKGRFSVSMPGTPIEEKVPTDVGDIQLDMHTFRLKTYAVYSVTYFDFPPSLQAPVEEILSNLISGVVEQVNGRIVEERHVALDNHPGRFLTIEAADGATSKVKFYAVDQRVYQIMIHTPRKKDLSEDEMKSQEHNANRFLESFKLLSESNVTKTKSIGAN